jgi:hypothetical protein
VPHILPDDPRNADGRLLLGMPRVMAVAPSWLCYLAGPDTVDIREVIGSRCFTTPRPDVDAGSVVLSLADAGDGVPDEQLEGRP